MTTKTTDTSKSLASMRAELQSILTTVQPRDLTADELAALLDVLRPISTRVVCGFQPARRPLARDGYRRRLNRVTHPDAEPPFANALGSAVTIHAVVSATSGTGRIKTRPGSSSPT
jgi:hypothetical protein